MTDAEDVAYIGHLYRVFLGRAPRAEEQDRWMAALRGGMSDRDAFHRFRTSKEHLNRMRVTPAHPPGHYYSPVVDPDDAQKYWTVSRDLDPRRLRGITLSMSKMRTLWNQLAPFIATTSFPETQEDRCRYYAKNNVYPIGDATILRAMMFAMKPQRIVEIGSGFSSACMLDTVDEMKSKRLELTFIDPDPARLKRLLRPDDLSRIEIIDRPVQTVDLKVFEELGKNDILFIDSSHVSKTGSDVNFEIFEILPRLKDGVIVHLHDIHYPFEYPEEWVFKRKYSWNEAYFVRAFLMYNYHFRVIYFTNLFAHKYPEYLRKAYPPMLESPGASLWLQKAA